jgi:hypothetical protein
MEVCWERISFCQGGCHAANNPTDKRSDRPAETQETIIDIAAQRRIERRA